MFGLDSRVATCKGVRGGPEAMVLELEPDALVLEPEAMLVLCQECSCLSVCLSGPNLTRVVNLHLSGSGLYQVSLRSLSGLSQVSLLGLFQVSIRSLSTLSLSPSRPDGAKNTSSCNKGNFSRFHFKFIFH